MKKYKYFIISRGDNDVMSKLLDLLKTGYQIISAAGTEKDVHYILMREVE